MPNGLICELAKALKIRDVLKSSYPDENHASECEVWAVYEVSD